MKLPRSLSGEELAKALRVLGYETTRQSGSHVRLTTRQMGEHHVTIPLHKTLRVGTLASIISDVAAHFQLSRQEVLNRLF